MLQAGDADEAQNTMLRIVDHLKERQVTGVFTHLASDRDTQEHTNMAISSLVDTWILLRDIELGGERNRGIYVLKSRGMAHSNQIREFVLSSRGIELRDAYLGEAGVLTGSARLALEAREKEEAVLRTDEMRRRKVEYERKCKALEAQISMLHADLNAERHGLESLERRENERSRVSERNRLQMAASRKALATQTATTKKSRKAK
jgi:circadian clock protein KaiC